MDYSAARWDDGEGPKKSLFKCDTENLCHLSAPQETDRGGFTALNTVFSNVFLAAKCHLTFWAAGLRRMISGRFHLCCVPDWDLITRKEPLKAMFFCQMFSNLPVWQVPRKSPIQERRLTAWCRRWFEFDFLKPANSDQDGNIKFN